MWALTFPSEWMQIRSDMASEAPKAQHEPHDPCDNNISIYWYSALETLWHIFPPLIHFLALWHKSNCHVHDYGMLCKDSNPTTAPRMVQQSRALFITPFRFPISSWKLTWSRTSLIVGQLGHASRESKCSGNGPSTSTLFTGSLVCPNRGFWTPHRYFTYSSVAPAKFWPETQEGIDEFNKLNGVWMDGRMGGWFYGW